MFNFQGASSLSTRLSRAVSQVSFAIIPNPPPFVNTFFSFFFIFFLFSFPFLQPPRVLLHCTFFLFLPFVLACGRLLYFTYYMSFSLHMFLLCCYILILFSLLLFLFSLLVFLLVICIFIFSLEPPLTEEPTVKSLQNPSVGFAVTAPLKGNVINLRLFAKFLGSMWASTPTDYALTVPLRNITFLYLL